MLTFALSSCWPINRGFLQQSGCMSGCQHMPAQWLAIHHDMCNMVVNVDCLHVAISRGGKLVLPCLRWVSVLCLVLHPEGIRGWTWDIQHGGCGGPQHVSEFKLTPGKVSQCAPRYARCIVMGPESHIMHHEPQSPKD